MKKPWPLHAHLSGGNIGNLRLFERALMVLNPTLWCLVRNLACGQDKIGSMVLKQNPAYGTLVLGTDACSVRSFDLCDWFIALSWLLQSPQVLLSLCFLHPRLKTNRIKAKSLAL